MTETIPESIQRTISEMKQPVHITITKNAKGDYQWEISIHETDVDTAYIESTKLDALLTTHFVKKE